MTDDFKTFVDLIIDVLRVLPEDQDYFRQIHTKKPLVPALEKLFPEGVTRIKVPCIGFGASEKSWYSRFNDLFESFVEKYKDQIDYDGGYVTVDKNKLKLMKVLVAHYLDEYTPENFELLKEVLGSEFKWLLDNKPSQKMEHFVILSCDPEDFYMASTKQPTTSCIGLESGSGHWEGICNALADPYRLMAYGTNGGTVEFNTNKISKWPKDKPNFCLKAEKFIARSWAMWDDERKGIFFPRWFGSSPKNLQELKINDETKIDVLSSSSFESPRYRAIRIFKEAPVITPTVYFDNMNVHLDEENALLSNRYGRSGGAARSTGRGALISRLGGNDDE